MNFLDPRLPERFWAKCVPEPNSNCWLWTAASLPKGYGLIGTRDKSKPRLAHRFAYVHLVGPIPDGLHIDHRVCSTPCCVNPAHMEAVLPAENTRRGKAGAGGAARQSAKTHCPHGHPYSVRNTRIYDGRRFCRECIRVAQRALHRLRNPEAKTRRRKTP